MEVHGACVYNHVRVAACRTPRSGMFSITTSVTPPVIIQGVTTLLVYIFNFLMDFITPIAVQASNVLPLEDYDGPRAPLLRQVSLDEERRDDCQGHWNCQDLDGEEEERGVRLFRALLLQHLRLMALRPPPCILASAKPDPRGWWMYWRDWRSLERAARRFRLTKARGRLAVRAEHISLLSLDEVAFEDIMQELCQACAHIEQRALVVLAFLCEVCARAVRVGGWCRATDWAVNHVAKFATPWAIRHGGWSAVIERADGTRREDTLLAGAAVAALVAFLLFCRTRLRHALL
ncbi:hypothetical protein evm_010988 [Chilo suppressalis]|nr:hypothetical protein evm_010988 [Chilo suppressalis]